MDEEGEGEMDEEEGMDEGEGGVDEERVRERRLLA